MNILIIYGGRSCEHDISIITACLSKGYFDGNIYGAYLSQQNICYLVDDSLSPKEHRTAKFDRQLAFLFGRKQVAVIKNNKIKKILDIDLVVNCCHGRCGEDGTVAALCGLANLPIVGSDLISSAVAMNKNVSKQMLHSLNFPVVEGVALHNSDSESLISAERLGYPLIVKPATLGSSIGISLCRNHEELVRALKTAFSYDAEVLCEKALENFYELNCAAMRSPSGKTETSIVDRPFTSHDILTFQDKYLRGEKICCSHSGEEVDPDLSDEVKNMTRDIYEKLGLAGVVRVDFLVCGDKIYVNEINSVPGSLAYGLWQNRYSPKQFGNILTHQAMLNFSASEQKLHSFSSGVLDKSGLTKK